MTLENLFKKAHNLGKAPGCYLFKGKNDQVLYVGKAKNLKARVTSYFNQTAKSPKTLALLDKVKDFDFILTETEVEAFVLENNLIKKYRPKYNIQLRDDKTYPYVMVNLNEPFPRLTYTRRPSRGRGFLVFGPFVFGSNISEVIQVLTKCFELRDCSVREFLSRKTPCLLYQLHQCSAPCVGNISEEDYRKQLEYALDIFRGKGKETLGILREKMEQWAREEAFERAGMVRDYIYLLESFLEKSRQENVEFHAGEKDVDIISFYPGEDEVDVAISYIRQGMLLGQKNFYFGHNLDANSEFSESFPDKNSDNISSENLEDVSHSLKTLKEAVLSSLLQHYSSTADSLPQKIFLPKELEDEKNLVLLQQALHSLGHENIRVLGMMKKFQKLWELTSLYAKECQRLRNLQKENVKEGLAILQDLLSLKERPKVLECYDIAIFQGSSPTAAQIVFREGIPDKASYRYYHLQEREEGNNDFAMLKEVMERRLKKGNLPDLFLIDGGLGQVNAVSEVLNQYQIEVPVVGIAKAKKDKTSGEGPKAFEKNSFQENAKEKERLIIPGRKNPFFLEKRPPLFRLMTQMRDEAHRFSRKLHHKAEKSRLLKSWLTEVPGIGPVTQKKILQAIEASWEEVKEMSLEELKEKLGVTEKIALAIKEKLS